MKQSAYKSFFLNYLEEQIEVKEPKNLYQPIVYILTLGGKRLRPILTLMSCKAFGGEINNALPAALAIEMFHNFSLVHDDIMDHADLRRGKKTVHNKWNINTGILSGDAMMLLTNKLMEHYDNDTFKTLMMLFNKTALEVCEGQQYDVDFETRNDVTIKAYLKMITFKTAVLVACGLKMGAIIAGTNNKNADFIYKYGLNLGIAFQLQDDLLDTFGNQKTFGKKIGGDILENKKTYLFLKTMKVASQIDKEELIKLFGSKTKSTKKIIAVTALYTKYKIPTLVKKQITNYTKLAYTSLENTSLNKTEKEIFINLGNDLLNRKI